MANNKTIKLAIYPDGTRVVICKKPGRWGYAVGPDWLCRTQAEAIRYHKAEGATVATEPNPSYRQPAAPTALDNFRMFFT